MLSTENVKYAFATPKRKAIPWEKAGQHCLFQAAYLIEMLTREPVLVELTCSLIFTNFCGSTQLVFSPVHSTNDGTEGRSCPSRADYEGRVEQRGEMKLDFC